MSRVGRLLLWVKAPRSLRHFDALCRTPVQAQDGLLRQILKANAETEFGRHHGFGAITSFRQFQEQVPISAYEDLEPYITAEMQGRPNQLTKSVFPTFGWFLLLALLDGMIRGHDSHRRHPRP